MFALRFRLIHGPTPRATFKSYHRFSMAAQEYTEAWLAGPHSTQFYTRTYVPPASAKPKAVIVYVHGFAEHVGRYTHFHPIIAKRGIAVFAFDQRGFGLTALDTTGKKSKTSAWGKTSWAHQMEDIDWAIKHAKKSFENAPVFLAGHSMVRRSTTLDSTPLTSHTGWRRDSRVHMSRGQVPLQGFCLLALWRHCHQPVNYASEPSTQAIEVAWRQG